MDFYLIHCWNYPGLRGQQFLQMLDPIVANSAYLHLPIGNSVLHGFPACQSAALASVWTVKQKQVDVT
jgi:hypothetical protein